MALQLCELQPAKSAKPQYRRSSDAGLIHRAGCLGLGARWGFDKSWLRSIAAELAIARSL
jgi:hypothetical protein